MYIHAHRICMCIISFMNISVIIDSRYHIILMIDIMPRPRPAAGRGTGTAAPPPWRGSPRRLFSV